MFLARYFVGCIVGFVMSHLQDLGKVASGLAMVVKESIKRAPQWNNVSNSAFDVLKAVTGTVTDLTGLTQGRVKELQNLGCRRRKKEESSGIGSRARDGTESHVSTSAAGGSRESSYLLNTLDSLGPPRSRGVSDRTEEVLSKVKEDILPTVPETPLSKPLERFASVDANYLDKASPSAAVPVRVLDQKEEEAKVDSEAIKAEQVLQASRIDGAL